MPGTSFLLLAFVAQAGMTERGIEAFRQGRYGEARALLEQSVSADRGDSPARAFLGMTKAADGDCGDAVREFTGNADPVLARMSGLAAVECEHGPEAFALLDRLEARFPADADVLYESAKLHRKAWDRSIRSLFDRAPASYRVNQISAEVFELEGKYGEAAAQFQKAIEKAPQALNLHFRLGRCLLLDSPGTENLEKAKEQFEAELKLNPGDAVAEYQVAQISGAQQKPEEAAARYRRAITLKPDFAEALIAVGKLEAQGKRLDAAVKYFEKAVAVQPANETARYNLMLAYRNLGRSADAQAQKKELDRLQKPPEGEFSEFLKKLGEKAPKP